VKFSEIFKSYQILMLNEREKFLNLMNNYSL